MINFEKTYEMPISKDETVSKHFTIQYGFDEDLIKNFPKDINCNKLLFLFVDVSDSQWFRENTNDNPNIMAVYLNVDENNLSKEILEKIVDRVVKSQQTALQNHWDSESDILNYDDKDNSDDKDKNHSDE